MLLSYLYIGLYVLQPLCGPPIKESAYEGSSNFCGGLVGKKEYGRFHPCYPHKNHLQKIV